MKIDQLITSVLGPALLLAVSGVFSQEPADTAVASPEQTAADQVSGAAVADADPAEDPAVVVNDANAESSAPVEPGDTTADGGTPPDPAVVTDSSGEPAAVTAGSVEDQVAVAYEEFRDLLQDEDFENAIPVGREVLQLAENAFGRDAAVLAYPVIDLAYAFRSAGLFSTAETYYLRGISLIEKAEGVYSPRLIDPLIGVGKAYHEAGQYDEAEDAYRRAQHVVHRKDGVVSLEQIPILDNLTDTFVRQGEIIDADREQRLAYRVTRLKYGEDDPRTVPATLKLAQWFRETRQYRNSGILYKRAVEVLANAYGETDPSIIEPLRGLADARAEHLRALPPGSTGRGVPAVEGREALERVLDIVEAGTERSSDQEFQAIIDLADWYLVMGKTDKALDLYRRGWDLLADFPNADDARDEVFGAPVRLYYNPHDLVGILPAWKRARYGEIYIDVEFTVTNEGDADDIVIYESNSPVMLKRVVKQAVQDATYRPRFVDGQPVATPNIRFRQIVPSDYSQAQTTDWPVFRQ